MNKLATLIMASAIAISATSCDDDCEPEIIDNSTTNVNVTINGHKFVDLGLPSGTLWAETNIGASTPYEDGDYFAWGETKSKTDYSEYTYKYGLYLNRTKYNLKDGKTTLDAADDAATTNWGTGCRMPSVEELQELKDKCSCIWQPEYNGVSGCLITGPNGNCIFLPAAGAYCDKELLDKGSYGYYWSRTVYPGPDTYNLANHLLFGNDRFIPSAVLDRECGFLVRPVATTTVTTSSKNYTK